MGTSMITIERILDEEFLKSLLKKTESWDVIKDHSMPDNIDEIEVKNISHCFYLCVKINNEIAGLIYFYPMNFVLYQAHIAILPFSRGINTPAMAEAAIAWLSANTPCAQIVAIIPTIRTDVLSLVKRCHFMFGGILPASNMFKGQLVDSVIYYRFCAPCQDLPIP